MTREWAMGLGLTSLGLASMVILGCAENPTAPPAAASAPATRSPGVAAKELAVPPGTTYIAEDGQIDAGQEVEYVIGEEKGSVFMVHALTPEADLDVEVYRADTGERIVDETPRNPNFFMARLPETVGYLVVVRGLEKPTTYRLEVEVPRRLVVDDTTSAVEVTSVLPANGVLAYLTPAGATVSAELTGGTPDSYLTAHGLAGTVFTKASENARTASATPVEANEGIVIRVHQGAKDGEIKLKVESK